MAFKQGNNPISRKTSPMRKSPFKKEASISMEDLKKMSAKQDAESKAQALKLPQIEKPGFDYEMDQDMSYPGGERGRDYDEDGLKDLKKDGMSRKEAAYFGLGKDDGKSRKEDKLDKTIDQLSEKMSDKKKKRKEKKLLKTADQLGMSRKAGYIKHPTLTVKGKPLEYNPKFDPNKLITDQSEAKDKKSIKKGKKNKS